MTVQAYGSVGKLIAGRLPARKPWTFPSTLDGRAPVAEANAGLLLNRLWLGSEQSEAENALRTGHLTAVAEACGTLPDGMLAALHQRRRLAAEGIAARHGPGWRCLPVLVTPEWRVVVGHGEDSVHESSLTISPTYGLPVVPGSALKGLAAAVARRHGAGDLTRLFGTSRPGDPAAEAGQGSVLVLDAVPVDSPKVLVDVLTPHVKPYYDTAAGSNGPTVPPAEYHNPVPVRFLAVGRTPLRTLLIGPADDARRVADLLAEGVDEYGLGGKTSAGYGYCTAVREEDPPS